EAGREIDPRQELVDRLLEYKRYKSVLDELQVMEAERSQRSERGYVSVEVRELAERLLVDVELESVSLYKLMTVFRQLMDRLEARENRVIHRIYRYNYTIADQQERILARLSGGGGSAH